jgi:AmmeMemoRadiSam system protein B
MKPSAGYREPAVAGAFYPGEPTTLAHQVESFLEGPPTLAPPGPIGLICPHAGYDYSGPTAGRAYREMKGRSYEAVVVLGPSHYDRFSGVHAWIGVGHRTPLGIVEHPAQILQELEAPRGPVHRDVLGHREEHSVEVQLPFLQRVAPGTPVLPLVLAHDGADVCRALGADLAGALRGRSVLLIASSDLYHGHSHEACERTDAGTLAAIQRNDPEELASGFGSGRFQACGRGPILAVLEACRRLGADRLHLLARTNSNEVTGQQGGYVVGYAALAVTPESGPGSRSLPI